MKTVSLARPASSVEVHPSDPEIVLVCYGDQPSELRNISTGAVVSFPANTLCDCSQSPLHIIGELFGTICRRLNNMDDAHWFRQPVKLDEVPG